MTNHELYLEHNRLFLEIRKKQDELEQLNKQIAFVLNEIHNREPEKNLFSAEKPKFKPKLIIKT